MKKNQLNQLKFKKKNDRFGLGFINLKPRKLNRIQTEKNQKKTEPNRKNRAKTKPNRKKPSKNRAKLKKLSQTGLN